MEERNPLLQPTHLLPKAGKTYRARGDIYILKASAQQTGGAFSLWEGWNEPGSGVPPHIQHFEEEAFFILEGRYIFHIGTQTLNCGPGEFVFVPRGVAHDLHNPGPAAARMLILQVPGGIHEQYFEEAWERLDLDDATNLPPPASEPPDFGKIMAAAQRHGLEILPQSLH